MGHHYKCVGFIVAVFAIVSGACSELPTADEWTTAEKRRGANLSGTDWAGITAQDLAILLPREPFEGLKGDTPTRNGGVLLEPQWVGTVSAAFADTAVGDALELENRYDDWEVVSIRIAPCSPLGHHPGAEASTVCWPEVRLVWQPNLYDFHIGWTTVDAFSDDRAIHALYRVLPLGYEGEAEALITEVGSAARNKEPIDPIRLARFEELRDLAVDGLMADTMALRDPNLSYGDFRPLDLRAETMGDDAQRAAFYERLSWFLSAHARPAMLHTLTAFSLPEGRNPSGDDIWVFLAFDGLQGTLIQREIEIVSPVSGQVIASLGTDETVASAAGDERVVALMENNPEVREELSLQVLTSPEDRVRLGQRINDPEQTLVPNTSCATCHSFNELTFNFHNLSYLQEMEMNIAPRVRNDVQHDMMWLRGE